MDGIAQAVADTGALKIYVGNVMTQEGETEGYTNADHIRAIFQHSIPGLFRLCLVNSSQIPAQNPCPILKLGLQLHVGSGHGDDPARDGQDLAHAADRLVEAAAVSPMSETMIYRGPSGKGPKIVVESATGTL